MRARERGALLLAAAVLLAAGCRSGGQEARARLDRETFIAVYVDLRRAALHAPEAQIEAARRDEVLEAHAVSEEDLLQFVDVHGGDTPYMAEVWAEVERRLAADRTRADSALHANPPSS